MMKPIRIQLTYCLRIWQEEAKILCRAAVQTLQASCRHSQFERIPLSFERQERIIQEQIDETLAAINELKAHAGENFSIKQMEKTRKTLETKLEKLRSDERKDDVITFEQLGVDRLFVDESHFYKNRAKRCA